MSPLFGGGAEKAAQEAAALAEFERLTALPRPELAVEVMRVFGPDGPRASHGNPGLNILQILLWLMSSQPRGTKYVSQLDTPVREALQLLENASLVLSRTLRSGTFLSGTSLGLGALADGSVAQRLQS